MKKYAWAAVTGLAGIAVGYARHCYLTGYIKGRKDTLDEIERMDRRYLSERRSR